MEPNQAAQLRIDQRARMARKTCRSVNISPLGGPVMAGKTISMGAVQAFKGKLTQVMTGKTAGIINHGVCGTQGRKSKGGGHTETDAE
jgi:hypothetical protein